MPLTTPQDLISFSLRAIGVLGVGQTALAEDYRDAFSVLNAMLSVWNRRRWMVYHLIDVTKVSTGAQFYSVGPGADFDTPRPDRLEFAFFRQMVSSQPNNVDYPLHILESREDYNLIALKGLTSFPGAIFYDSAFPWGYVYPWPIPQSGLYEIHLTLKGQLSQFASYVQSLNLPPEYVETIWTNLALRLAAIYPGSVVTPETKGLASASLQTVQGANLQIPLLRMPAGLGRGLKYNVFSDRRY